MNRVLMTFHDPCIALHAPSAQFGLSKVGLQRMAIDPNDVNGLRAANVNRVRVNTIGLQAMASRLFEGIGALVISRAKLASAIQRAKASIIQRLYRVRVNKR